jgi:lipoprotein-anchoring transpeptidase ErfK/SrfK
MKLLVSVKMLVIGVCALSFAAVMPANKAAAQGWGWGSGSSAEKKHIVSFKAKHAPGTIVVSFSDRRLYYVLKGKRAISYPIAVPKENAKWSGSFRMTSKRVNPTWTPTPDMRRENPKLPLLVRGGDPRNPLGVRALYVGNTLYRIHGTDAPWLIGEAVSHGCVRMFNEDVVDLYNRAPVGSKILVTYNRYKTSRPSYAGYGSSKRRNASFSNSFFDFGL